jgi:hypothetical protein
MMAPLNADIKAIKRPAKPLTALESFERAVYNPLVNTYIIGRWQHISVIYYLLVCEILDILKRVDVHVLLKG